MDRFEEHDELFEAKRKLYSLLLKKSDDELTNEEVDQMYHLAKDKSIQEFLTKALKEN